MNPDAPESTPPSSPDSNAALPPANPVPPFDWRYWARRLLVCNPFFLCSAALLLFGVNRLSLDPNFLGEEHANLLFNYSALQFYEWLVVVTAIILARRKIWYDSALLAVVENGLVLVPFMLISQGALMNQTTGLMLAGGAVCLAAGRALALRRLFPEFNLPPRALALGAGLLLLNAVLPILYPLAVVKDTDDWAGPNLWLWFLALPALIVGANLLPHPNRYGGNQPERHWLPLFNYTLWTAGTGAHVWSLSHVSGLPFRWEWLGPAAVAVAWTLFARLSDCVMTPGLNSRRAVLVLALLAPLVSFANAELFETLVLANAIGFGVLFMRGASIRTFARELLVLCLPLAAFGLPESVGREVMPYFTRASGFPIALSLLFLICSMRWFRIVTGCTGAVGLTILLAFMSPGASPHAYLQTAVIFVLTHSLAWREKTHSTQFIRSVAGFFWLLNAAVWVHDYGLRTDIGVTLSALLLLATWFAIWRVSHERPDLVVAAFAAAVTLCAPTDWLIVNGSTGLLALAASALLFALGFVVAWTRHRWERVRR
jgi:hypothetical protein